MDKALNNSVQRRWDRDMYFENEGPFWHLCTNGTEQTDIFLKEDDFKTGVTAIGLSLIDARKAGLNVKLYAFALMGNHLHELVAGPEADCLEFFKCQKRRLARFVCDRVSLAKFNCKLVSVPDLNALENEICYIHRNGYLVHSDEVPYSYEWSTGMYYFNRHMKKIPVVKFADLKYRVKREITKSAVSDKYDDLLWSDGYISPLSFCEIENGERLFRNAHRYFYKLSRNYESYGLIAKALGEEVFLSDEDMYSVICSRAKSMFNLDRLRELSPNQKLELARLVHKEYNASNSQIKRILNLPDCVLRELFPKPSRS